MSERHSKKWTEEELELVLNLYCKTPFGRLHYRNPDVKRLAEYLNRTASSVAMKLCNFASLDPALSQKGLSGCSKLDREVWNKFFTHENVIVATEKTYNKLYPSDEKLRVSRLDEKSLSVKVRLMQGFFRRTILSIYEMKCCITGINIPELLVASHIVPWRTDKKNRLNPRNGLCLNALHDKAFDRGLISFSKDMKLIISRCIPEKPENDFLLRYKGEILNIPEKFQPDSVFLEFHRENIFQN